MIAKCEFDKVAHPIFQDRNIPLWLVAAAALYPSRNIPTHLKCV